MKQEKNKIILIGKKGKELWYPTYAPHLILGTNKSFLDKIYHKQLLIKSIITTIILLLEINKQ
jgi:hypothetical protein